MHYKTEVQYFASDVNKNKEEKMHKQVVQILMLSTTIMLASLP